MAKKSVFLDIVREQLTPRFEALIENGEQFVRENFEEISQRMLWYICVGLYKTRTGTENLDIAGDENSQYGNQFLKAIKGFCENNKNVEKAVQVNARYGEYWGILRKALNIEAKGRAICFGASGDDVMVVPSNKRRYIGSGLFCVICEKETFGKKWLAEMNRRGWGNHITLIVTQGFSSCEVIETLMELKENISNQRTEFYVGVLHDCDIPGYTIMEDINSFFDIMDFGATFELLDQHNSMCWENLKEVKRIPVNQSSYFINNNKIAELKRFTGLDGDEFNAIFGENNDEKHTAVLDGFRLELDKLYVNIGIAPFCDYAEAMLNIKARIWDLNRVEYPYCSNPDEYDVLERKVTDIWRKLVLKATGKETYELNFTDCADNAKNTFIEQNRHYEATVAQVKDVSKIIRKQSRELQEIVDNNEENQTMIAQISELVDELLQIVDSNQSNEDNDSDDENEEVHQDNDDDDNVDVNDSNEYEEETTEDDDPENVGKEFEERSKTKVCCWNCINYDRDNHTCNIDGESEEPDTECNAFDYLD